MSVLRDVLLVIIGDELVFQGWAIQCERYQAEPEKEQGLESRV